MSRSGCILAVASLVGFLAGCGAQVDDYGPVDESTGAQAAELKGCEAYDSYTAGLGEATVACIGTIQPDSYVVKDGVLVRNFKKCTVAPDQNNHTPRDALRDIDDLLSLQDPAHAEELPRMAYCTANQWTAWRKSFLAAGNTTCPTYAKKETFGVAKIKPTPEEVRSGAFVDIEKYADSLPPLDDKGKETEVKWYPGIGKTYAYYEVAFPKGNPNKGKDCRTPQDCANVCGQAFSGFVDREHKHERYFVGDPTWWVGDEFPPGANPYLVPGFYHPMSFQTPAPGAIFGHRARATPGAEEYCSKYVTPTIHYKLRLSLYCVSGNSGCMSKCAPATAATYADSK